MAPCANPLVRAHVAIVACALPWLASAGGGGGENIFKLKAVDLDNWEFWGIFAGMVFYGVIIDRLQYFTEEAVKDYRLSKMIFDRCITEFMIFGIVAMSLFLIMNVVPDISPRTASQLTFCDMLVSFAACSLILLGWIYSCLRVNVQALVVSGSDKSILGWKPMPEKMQKQFMALNQLDDHNFAWLPYFNESLANQICNLININWKTWVITCLISLPMVYIKSQQHKTEENTYIFGYADLEWILVLLILVTWVVIRMLRNKLYSTLDKAGDPDEAGKDVDVKDKLLGGEHGSAQQLIEKQARWSNILALVLQLEAVLMCFLAGMYVMHMSYNIDYVHWSTALLWKGLFVAGCVIGLFLLGPLALLELTSIQAFVDPDDDVLSSIMAQVNEIWSDCEHIRRQMESKSYAAGSHASAKEWAKKELTKVNGTDTIAKSTLQKDLSAMGIRISKRNAKNIFDHLDVNSSDRASTGGTLRSSPSMRKMKDAAKSILEHQISVDTFIDMVFESHMDRCVDKSAGEE